MTNDAFERLERNEGYVLAYEALSTYWLRGLFGPDGAGQYWSVEYNSTNVQIVAARWDSRGELIARHILAGGSTVGCGAVDANGFMWVGETSVGSISKLAYDGTKLVASMTVTDGSNTYNPLGMVSLGGWLYVIGVRSDDANYRLFKIDVTPGSEAVDSWGASTITTVGTRRDRMQLSPTDTGSILLRCADVNRVDQVYAFTTALSPSIQTLTGFSPSAGLVGMHRAFGYEWIGGNVAVGSSPPQILKTAFGGTAVLDSLSVPTALRIVDFSHDANYLYAAVTGLDAPSDVGPNRVDKYDPSTLTLVESFNFSAGAGPPANAVLVISDPPLSPYPDPALVDAVAWVDASGEDVSLAGDLVDGITNLAPQGSSSGTVSTALTTSTINSKRALYLTLSERIQISGTDDFSFLFDGSAFTLAFLVGLPVDTYANRYLAITHVAVPAPTTTGFWLWFDGDKKYFVIRIGSSLGGGSYYYSWSTPINSILPPFVGVITVVFDPSTPVCEIRAHPLDISSAPGWWPLEPQGEERGVWSDTTSPGTPDTGATGPNLYLGDNPVVGGLRGYLGEMAAIPRALAEGELVGLVDYLLRKWHWRE